MIHCFRHPNLPDKRCIAFPTDICQLLKFIFISLIKLIPSDLVYICLVKFPFMILLFWIDRPQLLKSIDFLLLSKTAVWTQTAIGWNYERGAYYASWSVSYRSRKAAGLLHNSADATTVRHKDIGYCVDLNTP